MELSGCVLIIWLWSSLPWLQDGAGPGEYKSRTLLENVTAEEMRDFFWDDEFREHWDDMLLSSKTWEECPRTGAMVVQWVRKVVLPPSLALALIHSFIHPFMDSSVLFVCSLLSSPLLSIQFHVFMLSVP